MIILGPDGGVERIAHSETKRGVCATPYDACGRVPALDLEWWDDPRFVHRFHRPENGVAVCNNYCVLHGRVDLTPVRCSCSVIL